MKERFLPLFSVPFPWGGGTIKRKGKNKISEKVNFLHLSRIQDHVQL